MNLRKLVTAVAVAIGIGMMLVPPWMEIYTGPTGGFLKRNLGYQPVWNKPADIEGYQTSGVRIWSSRLSQQLLVLFALTLIARRITRRNESAESESTDSPE